MAFAESYRRQVALLLQTLPHVAAEDCFALKGGTAINLFIRDMPRLSVDIDVVMCEHGPVFRFSARAEHGVRALQSAVVQRRECARV